MLKDLDCKFDVNSVYFQLHRFVAIMDKQATQVLHQKFHLSHSHFLVLFATCKCQTPNQKTLARFLNITEPAVSRLIEYCVNKQWVKRFINPNNRSENHIQLTRDGENLVNKAYSEVEKMSNGILERIGSKEHKQLLQTLIVLNNEASKEFLSQS